MTPRDFLDQIVRPNLAEVEEQYGDLRRAINLVHSIDALAAHIYHATKAHPPGSGNDGKFREDLAAANPEFRLLRDTAKALKHIELDRYSPMIRKAGQVGTQKLGFGQARFGEGRFGSPPQVVIEDNDGKKRVLESVSKLALAFLELEMTKRGL